jgi:hypothetical protein
VKIGKYQLLLCELCSNVAGSGFSRKPRWQATLQTLCQCTRKSRMAYNLHGSRRGGAAVNVNVAIQKTRDAMCTKGG